MRYFEKIREQAHALDADGCTGVPDFFNIACLRHDIHYHTHHTTLGREITKEWADIHFRSAIRHLSLLGRWSLMAEWRYWAVRLFAGRAWKHT